MTAIKFCGLTRPEDAALASSLGASYLGVIFAGGPRLLGAERARVVLDAGCAVGAPGRAGVFGAASAAEIGAVAADVGLTVVQLHGDPTPSFVDEVRRSFGGAVWAALRTSGDALPARAAALFDAADAVVLDAKVDGALGGTGVALPWAALAPQVERARRSRTLVLAGGLVAGNVSDAIAALAPDVVDVSSGVESAPGIKDPALLRAFAVAALAVPIGPAARPR